MTARKRGHGTEQPFIGATGVKVVGDKLVVHLTGGSRMEVPLKWFPEVHKAAAKVRRRVRLVGHIGIEWPDLNFDLEVVHLVHDCQRRKRGTFIAPPSSDNLVGERGRDRRVAHALSRAHRLRQEAIALAKQALAVLRTPPVRKAARQYERASKLAQEAALEAGTAVLTGIGTPPMMRFGPKSAFLDVDMTLDAIERSAALGDTPRSLATTKVALLGDYWLGVHLPRRAEAERVFRVDTGTVLKECRRLLAPPLRKRLMQAAARVRRRTERMARL